MTQYRLPLVWLLLAASLVSTSQAWAWVRPGSPLRGSWVVPTGSGDLLNYVVVEVNGVPRTVRAGEDVSVIRGDRVLVREAYLKNNASPRVVQVMGLMRTKSGQPESRRVEFRTKDLASRQSEQGQGQVYAIVTRSKKILHGSVYLKIVEPTLRYAEVSINQTKRILRDGEVLRLSAKDLFKLDKVVTSLDGDDDVVFQIAERAHGEKAIRFLRQGIAFATIPLIVEE